MPDEKRSTIRDKDLFKFKKFPKEGEIAPQAEAIMTIIEKAGEIERSDLVQKIEKAIETNQDPARLLSYYKQPLIDAGYIQIQAAKPEAKPAADKKKSTKPKAKAKKAKSKKPSKKKASAPAPASEPAPETDQQAAAG